MARILIVSTYYLDSHPAPAVLRVRGLERYLRERGHEVMVFHSSSPVSPASRKSPSLLRWVGWPDSQLPFVLKNAIRYRSTLQQFSPDIVYITAPPFSTLLLLPLTNRPAFVEFRDVWSYDRILKLYRTPFQRWLTDAYEGYVLRKARRIITLNHNQKKYMMEKHGLSESRFTVLPHFYIPVDLKGCTPVPSRVIRICYMGTADWMKGLEKVLPAMSRMGEIRPIIRGKVKNISPEGARILPPLPPMEAIKWACRNCDILWVSLDRFEGHHLITSSKSRSFLATGKPIMATIPMDNPMAEDFRKVGRIYMADIDDAGQIESMLMRILRDWKTGQLMRPENPEIFRYDVVLQELLNAMGEETPPND